jgi:ribosomal protein L40E
MGRYVSIIGIFVIGLVMVIAGVYFFITGAADSTEYVMGVVLMLAGLLVTGVGAINGKRKMRSVGYFAEYPREPSRPPGPVREPARPAPAAQPEQAAPSRPTPAAPATQPRPEAKPQEKPAEKVVKIIVCPKCGSENQVTDTFCYSCGKKLRPKKTAK